MRKTSHILIAVLIASAALPAVWAQSPAAAGKARQLLLKKALSAKIDGTLVATLNRNKDKWDGMTPEAKQQHRERFYAFLKANPTEQANLVNAAERFEKLSPAQQEAYRVRAVWLKKVVASLTKAEREALKQLPPDQRARKLLELKAKLVDAKPAPAK